MTKIQNANAKWLEYFTIQTNVFLEHCFIQSIDSITITFIYVFKKYINENSSTNKKS